MSEVTASGLVTQRFLRGMPARQLEALAETASEVMFPARHRIFADGDYADKFWLIQSGYVTLDVLVPGEGLAVIGRVGIGGLVGWSWLLPPYQWAFGAVCVTDGQGVRVQRAGPPGPLCGRSSPQRRVHPAVVPCSRKPPPGHQDQGDHRVPRLESVHGGVTRRGAAAPRAAAPLPWLLRPDTAAGDLARNDPEKQVVFAGGPRPEVAAFAEVPQLAWLHHPVCLAAYQHAPPLAELQVKVVGLERDPAVPVRRDHRALSRSGSRWCRLPPRSSPAGPPARKRC